MTKLCRSPEVVRDLEAIRDTSRRPPRYAALVIELIIMAVERLTSFPESGRIVPERSDPAIREVIVTPYRVVYRLKPRLVEIASVFRASRTLLEVG